MTIIIIHRRRMKCKISQIIMIIIFNRNNFVCRRNQKRKTRKINRNIMITVNSQCNFVCRRNKKKRVLFVQKKNRRSSYFEKKSPFKYDDK